MTGAAVSMNGPAQLMTATAPESARSSEAGSSTVATRTSDPGWASPASFSFAASRPERMGVNPRLRNSETTKRPVCPYAPKTVTIRFWIIEEFTVNYTCYPLKSRRLLRRHQTPDHLSFRVHSATDFDLDGTRLVGSVGHVRREDRCQNL